MKVDFSIKQREFVAYIRNPFVNTPPDDVPEPRMAMYRELIFNNINNFLSSNFPVLRAILDDQQWFELVQDFFSGHVAKSPYFSEIPEEFISFLEAGRKKPDDFPFLLELAHYEWVEMALSISKEEPLIRANHDDLLERQIKLSPLAWHLAYQYPVHKISPDYLPAQTPAQATFLVVYRDQCDDVQFMEITPITYQLLTLIEENQPVFAANCLNLLAKELNHPDPAAFINVGRTLVNGLADKGIIGI